MQLELLALSYITISYSLLDTGRQTMFREALSSSSAAGPILRIIIDGTSIENDVILIHLTGRYDLAGT